ncbi:MAG: hypothetical protein M3312_10245 [Actinomycetota bacterium]|nr:hypothetical protein [Actinomycetota bacterium]
MGRATAVLILLAALAAYAGFHHRLPALSNWGDVAFLAFLAIPATFALVWLALPLVEAPARVLAAGALTLALIAALLDGADLEIPANFAKLAAATAFGWWFLAFFEAVWWVVLVAVLIIPVDLFSVARGPTREITENQPQVFDALSIFFRLPGESLTAQIGLTDVLFFGLFLGATVRFALRTAPTWFAMALSFGATVALAVALEQAGVAALPLLSAAFVLVNVDLLLRSFRRRSA